MSVEALSRPQEWIKMFRPVGIGKLTMAHLWEYTEKGTKSPLIDAETWNQLFDEVERQIRETEEGEGNEH